MENVFASTSSTHTQPELKVNEPSNSRLTATVLRSGHRIRHPAPRIMSIFGHSTGTMNFNSPPVSPIANVALPRKICRYHQINNDEQLKTKGNQTSCQAQCLTIQQFNPASDVISINIVPQTNVCLVGDKYLLLDQAEGSSLFKSFDITNKKEYVCKVSNKPCTNLLTAHFRLDGHPNVNQIVKAIDVGSKWFLFFNPSQGDLHTHIRFKKRLRENDARKLFRQMCEIVKTCHEEGIVLRDLKLRKFVFFDAEKTILKLETLEDTIVLNDANNDFLQNRRGCPAYVSPEILKANTQYSGKAADMWSLGVILYTMLVGRYPFNDSEHTTLFAKISRGLYTVPECLSAKGRCLIKSLLRREPHERITSADALYHPWLKQDESTGDLSRHAHNEDDQVVPFLNTNISS